MKSSSQRPDSVSDEQASLWAARLEGGVLTATDRAALEAWLSENPAHRVLLSEYCQFSADLEEQLPVLVAAGAQFPAAEKVVRSKRGWYFGAAGLAAAAAVALMFWVERPSLRSESIATSVGERRSLTLSDGTRVELSARTSLIVEATASERRVRLAQGEAYFEVAKDKSRPFFIETPAGSVRVTGTTFDVAAMPDSEFDVTVIEGTVQVRPAMGSKRADPYILHGGDRLEATPKGVSQVVLTAGDLDDAVAWRQGIIVLKGIPLSDVLKKISYYHGISITASDDVASRRLGGRYSLDDLDDFFASAEKFLPLQVVRDSNGNLQVTRRAGQ